VPKAIASIEAGLLQSKKIDEPQDITIYARYTRGGFTVSAQMAVHISFYTPKTLNVPGQYKTIRAAIDAATNEDTVIVADGTYTGPDNRDIDFKGKAITVRSESGPENCIIDCEQRGRGFYFQNGEGKNSILDGFTITGGYMYGSSWSDQSGGGIFCNGSSPTITNCIITHNSANTGGGMLNLYSNPTLTNCTFSSNTADLGGGIYCISSSPAITNCTISGNTAEGKWPVNDGGGIYCDNSSPKITNCTIAGNAAGRGGGVYSRQNSSPTIINCTISDNFAEDWGGGMARCCGSIRNCILWDNWPEQIYRSSSVTYSNVQGGWEGEGNIDADPCFIDAASGDYHLLPHSPCINVGDPAGGYSGQTDIDGEPRVMAGRVDMGADEFTCDPATLAKLEIMGPEKTGEHSSAQYTAIAYYECGYTADVTISAIWSLEPQICGTIDNNGLLHTERIETIEDITICARYSDHEFTVNAEKIVQVSPPVEVEIIGPEWIRENYPAQYKALVYYVDGQTRDVTDLAQWQVEPEAIATVEAGLLRTEDINEPQDINIYAAYTAGGGTVQTQMTVQVLVPPYIWYVPADYQTIQEAIDNCLDGEEVVVADGTYTGSGNRDVRFLGKAITVRSENGPENCIINCEGSKAKPHGGFVFLEGEDANSILDGFTIINGYVWQGGGIYCGWNSPTITNCIINSNEARDCGGAIYCGGSPTITNCDIKDNRAGWGGGIYNGYGSNPTISNCTISGNIAVSAVSEGDWYSGDGGGIQCGYQSNSTITNCTIVGNTAEGNGGGIACWSANNVTITNCTFAENSAPNGNALVCDSYNQKNPSNLQLTNCILWDGGNEIWNNDGSIITITYSDVQGGWPGQGNIDTDPHFAFPNDCHLMPDSACIDAGDPNYIAEPNETDIEGKPRIIGGQIDMGAYEYDPNSPAIAVSASSVSFSYTQDWSKPAPQTLLIRNCGAGTLNWQIVEDCNWLRATSPNGVSTGQIDEVILTVEPNDLEPGYYSCILTVLDPNAANSPRAIRVALLVAALLRVPSPDYPTIQVAIDAAREFDMVLVADGNYTGPGNKNLDFGGKAITVRSENGPNNCIIDCQRAGGGFYFHKNEDEDSVLDGFTITNGYSGISCRWQSSPKITNCIVSDNIDTGIICWESSASITNCIVSNNTGGGISCWESRPKIANCTIIANNGTGIFCEWGSSPTITNCTITGNSTTWGGGIGCEYDSSPIITNCTISGNSANACGGGIHCVYDSSPTISNCTISSNAAGYGGAIYCEASSSPKITNCAISGNTAEGGRQESNGGGIYCRSDSSPEITDCTFSGNSAESNGGAIHFQDALRDPIITNCTISGNSAGTGGGIYYYHASSTITNCTFAENSATNGKALACDSWQQQYPSNLQLTNCILWDGSNEISNNDNSTITITYSDVQGGWEGNGNINSDPCFVGPGFWDVNDLWVEGDYHLLEGSPCIDAGDPNYAAGPNETDLDGKPRVVDGDNDGNSVVDMGVYEYRPPTPAELVAELLEGVGGLELPSGITNSLEAKLSAALRALEDENEDNDLAAINTLGAFINAVEAQRGKKIPEAEADALIAAAQEIIELLSDG
jgi:parallel beta-helix repeat protein/predicted outer membrane repeat protein